MTHSSTLLTVSSALGALCLAASCTPGSPTPRGPHDEPAIASPSAPPVAAEAARSAEPATSSAPRVEILPPSLPRPPPPVVTAAMAGEPAAAALGEARLVATSCQGIAAEEQADIAARIRQMREEVAESYRSWAESRSYCWSPPARYRRAPMMTFDDDGIGFSGAGYGGGDVRAAVAPALRSAPAPTARPVEKARSASGTNNQVAGVDEADIVKTDGSYVYLAMGGALRIVEALHPRLLSTTQLPGSVRQMFVEGDRAVVYTSSGQGSNPCTYGYDCRFAGNGTSTSIVVLDIANRGAPAVLRRIELSGSLMAARRIGSAIHTVVADGDSAAPDYDTWPADLPDCGIEDATARDAFMALMLQNAAKLRAHRSDRPTIRDAAGEREMCSSVLRTAGSDGKAFTSLVSFDLEHLDEPATTATLRSRPGAVFASEDGLYLSVTRNRGEGSGWYSFYPTVDEVSEIHKFRVGARARDTRYVGSGVVPGHVLNQFAMDQWSGYLRVATTRGKVPDPNVESVVSILTEGSNGNLLRVGAIEHIAPGEDIRAVRFDGDRGYVVTFKKTDPLFVMDLYDPARPAVLGELKIPGFSTYMHRIDPDHLLSIGLDANDHGDFAYFDGVILQLFDVRDPTNPTLLHKEKIGTRGSSSEALTNHLAFTFMADRGLLAVPMTICEGGGDGSYGDELAFSGLLVYDVSLEGGFVKKGGIDHGTPGASCSTWWTNATSTVKRSIFLDDLVYSIAEDRLKVQNLDGLGRDVANIALR